MGHDIENTDVKRSDYRNEDLLNQTAKLMNMRPYVIPAILDREIIKTTCYEDETFGIKHLKFQTKKGC